MRDELITITHTADEYDKYLNAVVPPVFLNSLHLYNRFEDYLEAASDPCQEEKFVYGRDQNPTVHILERKIAELEHGARAVVFASGMGAAAAAIMTTCCSGSHIVCMRDVYQPVKRFINNFCVPKFGMTVTYVSGNDLDEIETAMKKANTTLMIIESPATFVFRVVDLEKIAKLAHQYEVKTYIDNTCLTPLFQKPLDLGIDICMHTMSKYIGGHSDILGGVLVSKDEDLMCNMIKTVREWYASVMGPMEAWLAIRGLRTLPVRIQEHQRIGMEVAGWLEKNPKVKKVYYTGLSSHPQADLIKKQQKGHTSLMSIELDADPEEAVKFINRLHLFGKGCSWGGFESLAIMPLYKAEQEELDFLQANRGLIRLYCGLEGSDNLIEDLERAFAGM